MPVASSITEMDLQASESLLEDFRQRSRRFRRRIRRRAQNLVDGVGADHGGDADDEVEPGLAQDEDGREVDLNAAIPEGGDAASDDDWSFDRIDEAKRLDHLEQILLKENNQFHLHC